MRYKNILVLLMTAFMSLGLVSCTNSNTETKAETSNQTESSSNNESESNKKSTKKEYQEKLDNIQKGLSDLDELYAGNTIDMEKAAEEERSRWDKALNETYDELKNQLSKEEMSELEKEEAQWIKDRDNTAKDESLKYEGGTAEQLTYTKSLAESTKKRCYELVDKYMK